MAKLQKDAYQNPDFDIPMKDRVQRLIDAIAHDPDYCGPDTVAHRAGNITLTHASAGRTEYTMTVTAEHCNKGKNMHGGMACIVLDNLTSTALLTLAKPGFLDAGHVSRTITMSYLRPVPLGAECTVVCEAVQAGRNTANLKGEIRVNGKTCITCVHDKAVFQKGFVHPNQKNYDYLNAKL
jgi:acyl-coenzyme A thioesterase 13